MRKCLCFLLAPLFAVVASAQLVNYDSLKRVATATTPKERIAALSQLADYYGFIPDSEYHYAVLGRDAAAKAGDKGAEAYAIAGIGDYYMRIGNYVKALGIGFQVLKTLEERRDSTRIANTYNGIAHVYAAQHNYAVAETYYHQCYRLAHSIKDYTDEVFGAMNLAWGKLRCCHRTWGVCCSIFLAMPFMPCGKRNSV